MRTLLGEIADKTAEWAGIPMPLEGERLVIEPSYPWAAALGGQLGRRAGVPEPEVEDGDDGWIERNRWYSDRKRCDIIVMERAGKISWGRVPGFHSISHALSTLGCSVAWGIEQEQAALKLLGTMVRHHTFKHYLLTGMFLEQSPRSGVTYIFRRLRPTVAVKAGLDGKMRILAALCMHPIAYYAGSWAGAMCPTDDVIAHLALMRGDEAMFWRRCNQHPPYRPEAGL